jgi:isopentenyldiphosphate isomerase
VTAPGDAGVEQVLLVDEQDRPVGQASRARMRAEGLLHRATFIFVFARDGRLLLQRRTLTKDLWPGYYDAAAGGVVAAGEDYDTCARRELVEELGIEPPSLTRRFHFRYEDGQARCFGQVYTCTHDGPFRLQPEEVAEAHFVDAADVLAGRYSPATPDTVRALARLLEEGPIA